MTLHIIIEKVKRNEDNSLRKKRYLKVNKIRKKLFI